MCLDSVQLSQPSGYFLRESLRSPDSACPLELPCVETAPLLLLLSTRKEKEIAILGVKYFYRCVHVC